MVGEDQAEQFRATSVESVRLHPSGRYVIVLKEADSSRGLALVIERKAAEVLANHVRGKLAAREPGADAEATVRVEIWAFVNDRFEARTYDRSGRTNSVAPSQAIITAFSRGIPIHIRADLLDSLGVEIPPPPRGKAGWLRHSLYRIRARLRG